jgi:hypothetical protein
VSTANPEQRRRTVKEHRLLMLIAGTALFALLLREFPAMVRYIKIERM